MAHSYVHFRGRYEFVKDTDLLIFITFMLEESEKSPTDNVSTLGPLAGEWREAQVLCGAGCMDLKLDTYLADKVVLNHVVRLIERVKSTLRTRAPDVPREELNLRMARFGVRFLKDWPVEK